MSLGKFRWRTGLSLQSDEVCSGKLERIFPSINFSSEFSRIHAKETQILFNPTKANCYKLVQQRGKTWSSSYLRIFQQKRPIKKRCTGKLSAAKLKCKLSWSTDRNDPQYTLSREDELSKFISLFKWEIWKETCDDHRGFRCAFWYSDHQTVTPVAGPIFETKNRAIFLERFFGRGITAREQLSRAKNSLDFK